MNILVNVINQKLKIKSNTKRLVSGTQKFIRFEFSLDDAWDDLLVFAQFIQNGKAYNDYLDENNSVYLPPEIKDGEFNVLLYGSGSNTIATTNYLTFEVDKNILISDAQSTEITESLYNQLVNIVDTYTSQSISGTPIPASSVSLMTDHHTIYLYTGSEDGYVKGDLYYYSNGELQHGKTYGVGVIDSSLTIEGAAADSKTVGDEFESIRNTISGLSGVSGLPDVDSTDNGKTLQVVDGEWVVSSDIGDELDELKIFLGSVESLTWAERMAYVRAGKGADLFPVGTQFSTPHGTFGSILWDVVAHDHFANPNNSGAHTMTLMMHYSLSSDNMAYSVNDAVYYAENGLVAGNYSFTVSERSNAVGGQDNGLTYYFTLANSIPVGGQIRRYALDYNVRYSKENALAVYSSWQATEPTELITPTLTPINGAVSIDINNGGFIDNACPDYDISAIRQWLNSDADEGEWFVPATEYDRVGYSHGMYETGNKLKDYTSTFAGFMRDIDHDFLSYVGEVAYPCVSGRVSLSRDPFAEYTVLDKFTLPSLNEVGLSKPKDELSCGRNLKYYENVDDKQRIKYRSAVLSANHQWVTRQPATLLSGSPWGIRSVTTKGAADSTGGTSSNNFVVMCTLY